ncbi:MAG: nucleotidyltransferase domain-containing protein [Woronichinia naegeliana WA131]|jgi:predicted nucleotidyltransferase|uniref:Nucleotidyltransferase domain-containing protein n=1 Tax=Woronichinia naegeliana WA131 TaxID=2824559 RepID=A0A977KZ94_9CYAN|nr:MAG: nucleotidyltransferase domain-containing protein [Woronichinia naegeliana WA131]
MIKQVTNELLDQITHKLVATLNPEQIILFGSHAYGEPNEDSDIDLLVIVSQSNEPRYRRSRLAYKALRGICVPTDVIIMTREEVKRKVNVRSSLISRVIHDGRVLYG